MEKGTIQKIFDYYFGKPKFKDEILRAIREFFNKPNLGPGDKLELQDENDEKMFNEWFIFDFKLSNGKTPLEDFYAKNPYNLNMVRLQIYKDLQENYFGFYKVKEIRLGEGLTLENLQTGKVYEVREFTATFGLKEGQVFSGRVGRVGDHYELVGANPSFGPVRFDKPLENQLRKEKMKFNPKILRDLFLSKEGEISQILNEESLSSEEAEDNFRKVLKKYNLDRFVSVETVKEWIYNQSTEDPINFLNLLCSLLYPDMKNYNQAITEILDSFNVFYNLCPQKTLGGKSPFEKRKELDEKEISPDIMISIHQLSPPKWGRNYHKALEYMKKREFKKGLSEINKVFSYLLENKVSYPEIYRLYANKAACHFALEEIVLGEKMLKISIELNPFYGFAKQQLKKLERYKKDHLSQLKKIKKDENVACDIAYQYYQFLKSFKINFAHILKDTSIL